MRQLIVFGVALAVAATSHAEYIVFAEVDGASAVDVVPGEVFTVDVIVTADASDFSNTALFQVVFSQPGLILQQYDWGVPYVRGSLDDLLNGSDSPSLPQAIENNSFGDDSAADIELSNAVDGTEFNGGLLATLEVTAPQDYMGASTINVDIVPDQFFNSREFGLVPASSGAPLLINVVPEPSAAAMLLFGLSLVLCRRGRRCHST